MCTSPSFLKLREAALAGVTMLSRRSVVFTLDVVVQGQKCIDVDCAMSHHNYVGKRSSHLLKISSNSNQIFSTVDILVVPIPSRCIIEMMCRVPRFLCSTFKQYVYQLYKCMQCFERRCKFFILADIQQYILPALN